MTTESFRFFKFSARQASKRRRLNKYVPHACFGFNLFKQFRLSKANRAYLSDYLFGFLCDVQIFGQEDLLLVSSSVPSSRALHPPPGAHNYDHPARHSSAA